MPARLVGKLSGARKALTGDYHGARECQPGDSPRVIHRKKSVRGEGLESLIVKVFGSEELEKASGGRSVVVAADLTAPNPSELDALLQAVYEAVLLSLESRECLHSNVSLLKTLSGKLYSLKGKAVDALYGLNVLLVDEKIEALYDYENWVRSRPPVTEQPYGALRDLEERGVRKGTTVQLVFSKAMAFKYYCVSRSLRRGAIA